VSLEGQKTRLMLMLAITAVCFVLAAASIVGHLAYGVGWLLPAFVACIAVGVAAQVWFVLGLMKSGRAPS
jgi:Na+/glutamate symporter